jgi:tetratricopeptide (TPR) repeat protein
LDEGYFWRAQYYYGNGNIEQAAKEFEKAIKYNPNFSAAYYDLGYLVYILDYNQMDFVKGLQYIHKGVSIEHGEARARILRNLLGDAYGVFAGFPEKQNYYYEEAFKLDNDTNSMNGFRTDEEVIESLKKSYLKDSNNDYTAFSLAKSYMKLGQNKEALRYFRKIEKKFRDNESFRNELIFFQSRSIIGRLYWIDGNKKEAEKWFNEQKKLDEESIKLGRGMYSIDANFDLFTIYEFTGEKEKALENLRIVNTIRICPWWMMKVITDEQAFKSIRNEPEFQKIMSELEAKYQAEHERVRKWLEEQGKL